MLPNAIKSFQEVTVYTYDLEFKALNWVSVRYMSSSFRTSPPGNVSRLAIAENNIN